MRQNSSMRCLLLLVTALTLTAAGEMSLTVEKLKEFVRSAAQMKQPDKQVAETLRHFKMAEKLDDRTIEELQSLGAGPKTVAVLKELGDAVKAFTDDLKAQGNMQRVLVMTFSEFGRRVSDNANGGTDHGAAAPLFIVGNKVNAGLLGTYPSLAPEDLFQGDIKYNVDFRSVYAAVLENWLKTPSVPILGRQFQPLPVV